MIWFLTGISLIVFLLLISSLQCSQSTYSNFGLLKFDPCFMVWYMVASEWKSFSPTLCDPMDYTVHGILQPRIVEWVAVPFSREASQLGHWTQVSCIADGIFTSWATSDMWLNFSKCSISTWKNVHSVIVECTVALISS